MDLRWKGDLFVKGKAPKLPLTPEERAKHFIALAQFQTIPYVGPDLAKHVIDLGVYSLSELKGKNPAELFDRLERLYGFRIDPCVEDGIRLIVHHAETPCSEKRWRDFTEERKLYRQKHGYPDTRPKR